MTILMSRGLMSTWHIADILGGEWLADSVRRCLSLLFHWLAFYDALPLPEHAGIEVELLFRSAAA